MSLEFGLFLVVGAVAVLSAILMLLSRNAVHSALFLIINLACVAFLFLMLNAPFLAMIQIAVYAGAIMVLFLFVIMLLGAEQVEISGDTFPRWLTGAAIVLAAAFLAVATAAILRGQIDLQQAPPAAGQLRVVNAATDLQAVDVAIDGNVVAVDVRFRQATPFLALEPGEHELTLTGQDADKTAVGETVTLEAGAAQTAIVYGEGTDVTISVLSEDIGPVEDRASRLQVINVYPGVPVVDIVVLGGKNTDGDNVVEETVIAGLSYANGIHHRQPEGVVDWQIIESGNPNNVLYRVSDLTIERGTSDLLVITGERLFDNSIRAVTASYSTDTAPSFGGPQQIGQEMLSTYLLPFELVSVLLLVAIVGAVVLTQRVSVPAALRRRDVRRKVSRPLTTVISAQTGTDLLHPGDGAPEQPEAAGD